MVGGFNHSRWVVYKSRCSTCWYY